MLCRLDCVTTPGSLLLCQKTVVNPAPAGHCHMQVYNLAGGNVNVTVQDSNLFPESIPYLQVQRFSSRSARKQGSARTPSACFCL